MKNILSTLKQSLILLIAIASIPIAAQETSTKKNDLILSTSVGYDLIPAYKNQTPFIDYEGGLTFGASADYYFNFIGIGVDFDYLRNSPQNTYPTENLFLVEAPLTALSLSEEAITRMFLGIGPNIRYQTKNRKFSAELSTRAGLSTIKGGRTVLTEDRLAATLNYHSGYDVKNVLAAKGQIRFTYFLTANFGFHLGAYYLRHFGATELNEFGFSSAYRPFSTIDDKEGNLINSLSRSDEPITTDPNDTDSSSLGAFAGISYRFTQPKKATKHCPVCRLDHKPHCSAEAHCNVAIVAKDKFSKERIPDAEIILEDAHGAILQTARTNVYGAVIFDKIPHGTYTVKGSFFEVALESVTITAEDFQECTDLGKPIEKELFYGDESFILEGEILECNSIVSIPNVDVLLKDVATATQKNTISDKDGKFNFKLRQVSTFKLKGNKDGYFSHEVEVNTRNYDRTKSLFIDFQMCVDPCGKAIRLENINFDLGKWDILPIAESELAYIIELMIENPDIKVEMSSHTDARGSTAFNQKLSQKRAESTVDYLVAKGIAKDRLIAIGLGETKPLNICIDYIKCTEEKYAVNRRTEFKVICEAD